jgi:hypothetical protein
VVVRPRTLCCWRALRQAIGRGPAGIRSTLAFGRRRRPKKFSHGRPVDRARHVSRCHCAAGAVACRWRAAYDHRLCDSPRTEQVQRSSIRRLAMHRRLADACSLVVVRIASPFERSLCPQASRMCAQFGIKTLHTLPALDDGRSDPPDGNRCHYRGNRYKIDVGRADAQSHRTPRGGACRARPLRLHER